jgi:hypothetical protein
MLLLAALLPRLGTSKVADGLNGGTLDRVVLAGGLVGLRRHDVRKLLEWYLSEYE